MTEGAIDDRGRCDARKVALGVLTSWWFLLALALWALNDRYGKFLRPGIVTGKASDVLGVLVLPLLVAALIGMVAGTTSRRSCRRVGEVCVGVVAVGFAAVKLSGSVAGRVSEVWSVVVPNRFVADRTDLVALLAAPVAFEVWRAAVDRAPVAHASPGRSDGRTWAGWPRLALGVAIVLAGSAVTTATSCYDPMAVNQVYQGTDGQLYALPDGPRFATSDDGLTWKLAPQDAEPPEPMPDRSLVPSMDDSTEMSDEPEWAQPGEVCGRRACWSATPGGVLTERDLKTGATRELPPHGSSECGPTLPFAAMTVVPIAGQEVLFAGDGNEVLRVVAGEEPTHHRIDFPEETDLLDLLAGGARVATVVVAVAAGIAGIVAVITWGGRRYAGWGR